MQKNALVNIELPLYIYMYMVIVVILAESVAETVAAEMVARGGEERGRQEIQGGYKGRSVLVVRVGRMGRVVETGR